MSKLLLETVILISISWLLILYQIFQSTLCALGVSTSSTAPGRARRPIKRYFVDGNEDTNRSHNYHFFRNKCSTEQKEISWELKH